MRYLFAADLLLIHSMLIDEIGGIHGVRDLGAVAGLADAPRQIVFGRELYPTIFSKAALYARSTILYHPFSDGNKRTGMTAASVFLENNGYSVVAREGEIEECALRIAVDKLEIDKISSWFKKHSRRLRKQ